MSRTTLDDLEEDIDYDEEALDSLYERGKEVLDDTESEDITVGDILAEIDIPETTTYDVKRGAAWASYFTEVGTRDIELDKLSGEYAVLRNLLEDDPVTSLMTAFNVVEELDDDPSPPRIKNLDEVSETTLIEDVRADHIRELVTMDVMVTQRSKSYPRLTMAVSACSVCAQVDIRAQERFNDDIERADACPDDDCGGTMLASESHDAYQSMQEVIIQDQFRAVGASPADMPASLAEDLVYSVEAGEEVRVAALILETDSDSADNNYYAHILGLEHSEERFEDVEVSESERERIESLSDDTDIHDRLASSIANHLEGGETYDLAQDAILHQLAGAPDANFGNQNSERGEIHIALVGDPGTGKTHLAKAAKRIAPKSAMASADSSSKVGLTASVQREERFNSSEWTVEGGAVVRAHGGLCVIDELDKADDDHQKALHNPMSEGMVKVNKANIDATLAAESSLLVTANPVDERFDLFDPLSEQIGIQPALLSRFDAIVPFVDSPDREQDEEMMNKYLDSAGDSSEFTEDFLTKYISVSRQHDPDLTHESVEYLKDIYGDLRSESDRQRVAVTPRVGGAIRRLAQASARLRLAEEVSVDDMDRARDIVVTSLKMVATDQYGNLDADTLGHGETASTKEHISIVASAVSDLFLEQGNAVEEGRIVDYVLEENEDMNKARVRAMLKKAHQNNAVWKNGAGYGVN